MMVWRQAQRYEIPSLAYINKMDKVGANFWDSVNSIKCKLAVKPLILQLPIGQQKDFEGLVDIIKMNNVIWGVKHSTGKDYKTIPLTPNDSLYNSAVEARIRLVETLADFDDDIADLLIHDVPVHLIQADVLQKAVRRATVARMAIPVLCGSSFKNKGVQPLLDSVVHYLPTPLEREHDFLQWYENEFCAMAFKTVYDRQRGALTFLRVYSGQLKSGGTIYNVNLGKTEKVNRLLHVSADEYMDITAVSAGNIVVTSGLKEVRYLSVFFLFKKGDVIACLYIVEKRDTKRHP